MTAAANVKIALFLNLCGGMHDKKVSSRGCDVYLKYTIVSLCFGGGYRCYLTDSSVQARQKRSCCCWKCERLNLFLDLRSVRNLNAENCRKLTLSWSGDRLKRYNTVNVRMRATKLTFTNVKMSHYLNPVNSRQCNVKKEVAGAHL